VASLAACLPGALAAKAVLDKAPALPEPSSAKAAVITKTSRRCQITEPENAVARGKVPASQTSCWPCTTAFLTSEVRISKSLARSRGE